MANSEPSPQTWHIHELNNRFGVAISSLTYISKRMTNDLDKRLVETALQGVRHAQEYVHALLDPIADYLPEPPPPATYRKKDEHA